MEKPEEKNSPPIVSLSFFSYSGFRNKFWAFTMMQFGHRYLQNIEGLRFYRLLGSGSGNGFKWSSDFSTYALLTVWDTEAAAASFLENSELHKQYRERSAEQYTVFMTPVRSRGSWGGLNPFKPDAMAQGEVTAVITRATIKTRQLLTFWKQVPATSQAVIGQKGLLFAKGIGEWPIKQMATFSLWKDDEAMQNFAYKEHHHLEAIRKTKELDWYKEELFARFKPFRSIGTWEGERLLPF
jgi:heme-degrading monooxygenase HmoA